MSAKRNLEQFEKRYQTEREIREFASKLEESSEKNVIYDVNEALRCGDQWKEYIKTCTEGKKSTWFAFLQHGTKQELISEYIDEMNDYAGMCEMAIDVAEIFKARFGYDIEDEVERR